MIYASPSIWNDSFDWIGLICFQRFVWRVDVYISDVFDPIWRLFNRKPATVENHLHATPFFGHMLVVLRCWILHHLLFGKYILNRWRCYQKWPFSDRWICMSLVSCLVSNRNSSPTIIWQNLMLHPHPSLRHRPYYNKTRCFASPVADHYITKPADPHPIPFPTVI